MKKNLLEIIENGINDTISDNYSKNEMLGWIKGKRKGNKKIIEQLDIFAADFIREKFNHINKGDCFKFEDLDREYFSKSFHSVVLYNLGLKLRNVFEQSFDRFKEKYLFCPDMSDPFEYIWRLTSFYHDVMAKYEKKEKDIIFDYLSYIHCPFLTVESFLNTCSEIRFDGIKHSIYRNNIMIDLITKNIKDKSFDCTYTDNAEKIVNRYFRKRLHMDSLDHGIISGYVLYNQLICGYLKELNDYQMTNPNHKVYEDFSISKENINIKYRPVHIHLFKYIADAIIVHNIWHYDENTKQEYKLWGLEELSNNNRLTIKDNPLAFMLGLLDTIEPIKFFCKEDDKIKPKKVLENISINWAEEGALPFKITLCKEGNSRLIFDDWYKKLKSMECWLDLKVDSNKNSNSRINAIEITIPAPK